MDNLLVTLRVTIAIFPSPLPAFKFSSPLASKKWAWEGGHMCYFPSLFDQSSSNACGIVGGSSTDEAKLLHNNYRENSSFKLLFHSDRSQCTVGIERSMLITVHLHS